MNPAPRKIIPKKAKARQVNEELPGAGSDSHRMRRGIFEMASGAVLLLVPEHTYCILILTASISGGIKQHLACCIMSLMQEVLKQISTKSKFIDKQGPYLTTCPVVEWADIFTKNKGVPDLLILDGIIMQEVVT
jgi:hypothetical protein